MIFEDSQNLSLVEGERAHETRLSDALIKACRKRINFIRQANDERDLRNWRSLHYENMEGEFVGQRSIRLNDQWRLMLRVENDCRPPRVTILGVEDYH